MSSAAIPFLRRLAGWMNWPVQVAALILGVTVYVVLYLHLWRFVSYPIELEWREGAFWAHALAQSYGTNIFKDEKIAYVLSSHGIFDHIVKGTLAALFRAWEPQYLLRIFVLVFPMVSFLAVFGHNRRNMPATAALVAALCLSAAMLVAVHDIGYWVTCIGRTDSTAFTLIATAYLCYSTNPSTRLARVLRHVSYLAMALVLSTNWKWYPVALVIPALVEQRQDTLRLRELVGIYLQIAGYTLGVCAFFIVAWFHGDAAMYYRYFFGFFGAKSPMPPYPATFAIMVKYVRTPGIAFLVLLSVVPIFLEGGRLLFRRGHWPRILAAIAICLSLLVSILALKMNFMGGGYWYLCPQVIVLMVFYNSRYRLGPGPAAVILAVSLGILARSDNRFLMRWYHDRLGESLPAARLYAETVVRLDREFGVYSDEAHFFKRSRDLPPVDMGDFAEAYAKTNFLGPRFTAIIDAQQARVAAHEPVLAFVGQVPSAAFKQLAANEEYCLLLQSPTPAIGGAVYVRLDHLEDVQRFLAGPAKNPR